jgi:hypothetical protein
MIDPSFIGFAMVIGSGNTASGHQMTIIWASGLTHLEQTFFD